MPELPEVETVRLGLAPTLESATIKRVVAGRRDLRFPLPEKFEARLRGVTITTLRRRGKYLIGDLSTGESLVAHLGMSGRFTVLAEEGARKPGVFAHSSPGDPKHDHVIIETDGPAPAKVVFNDPRRFGFMDLVPTASLERSRHFKSMGPEPLGEGFSAAGLSESLKGKKSLIKAALLDQRIVAGLGNIYVSEALFRAGVSPRRRAGSVAGVRAERLYQAIVDVLTDAIAAGGSSLRDFSGADGALGYFQHRFEVYDRQGLACPTCQTPVERIVQAGRSTFFCPSCQR